MRTHDPRFRLGWKALAGAALAAIVLLGAAPATAEVPLGEDAPEVEAQDFINTQPVKLTDLSGRLILLELFTTT
jgi:hypothetical protein